MKTSAVIPLDDLLEDHLAELTITMSKLLSTMRSCRSLVNLAWGIFPANPEYTQSHRLWIQARQEDQRTPRATSLITTDQQAKENADTRELVDALALKATTELHNSLGLRWRVYRLVSHQHLYHAAGVGPEKIRLGYTELPWSGSVDNPTRFPICQRVVVMTYEQVSDIKNNRRSNVNDDTDLSILFDAMVFDEAQSVRRAEENLTGQVLRQMDPSRSLFLTGTPLLKSPVDLRGYFSLMERPEWTLDADHNLVRDVNGEIDPDDRYTRLLRHYADCKREDRLPDEDAFPNEGEEWQPAVRVLNGITDERQARARLLNTGRVHQWPATLFHNSHQRNSSLPRKDRFIHTWPIDKVTGTEAEYAEIRS